VNLFVHLFGPHQDGGVSEGTAGPLLWNPLPLWASTLLVIVIKRWGIGLKWPAVFWAALNASRHALRRPQRDAPSAASVEPHQCIMHSRIPFIAPLRRAVTRWALRWQHAVAVFLPTERRVLKHQPWQVNALPAPLSSAFLPFFATSIERVAFSLALGLCFGAYTAEWYAHT